MILWSAASEVEVTATPASSEQTASRKVVHRAATADGDGEKPRPCGLLAKAP